MFYLIWNKYRCKVEPIDKEFSTVLYTPKIVIELSNIWVGDPGSGKTLSRIPNPVVKKAPDPRSRITGIGTDIA